MQQSKLSFQRITADDAAQQRMRIAAAHAAEMALLLAPPAVEEQRGPGRPKRAIERVLGDTAVGAEQERDTKRERSKYTNWFSSPYINDVLAAYRRHGHSAKAAIAVLQRDASDSRTRSSPTQLYAAGLTMAISCSHAFKPSWTVTQQQPAALVARAFCLPPSRIQ